MLGETLWNGSGERSFTVIDVPDRTDVNMRFITDKNFFAKLLKDKNF